MRRYRYRRDPAPLPPVDHTTRFREVEGPIPAGLFGLGREVASAPYVPALGCSPRYVIETPSGGLYLCSATVMGWVRVPCIEVES